MVIRALVCWIASVKGRGTSEGGLPGFLFGPFGCLIEALLPNQMDSGPSPVQVVTITPEQAAQEQEQARRREYQGKRDVLIAARQSKLDAEREAAQKRAAEARRQAWEWFKRVVIRFGWFRALPETAQPIVVGLGLALPVNGVIVVLFQPVKPVPSKGARVAPAPIAVQADPDRPPAF